MTKEAFRILLLRKLSQNLELDVVNSLGQLLKSKDLCATVLSGIFIFSKV